MIDQTPYLGSRPVPLDTPADASERAARIVAALILLLIGLGVWHLALVLPALLWGR